MTRRGPAWVVAGLAAALLSSIPGMAWVLATDEPWWRPIQAIASLVGIERIDAFSLSALVVGGALHLVISLGFALPFAAATVRLGAMSMLVAGAAWGVLVWLVNFQLAAVLGWFDVLLDTANEWVELAAHVSYGLVLAGTLVLLRRRVSGP